jgi:hypothetical protein
VRLRCVSDSATRVCGAGACFRSTSVSACDDDALCAIAASRSAMHARTSSGAARAATVGACTAAARRRSGAAWRGGIRQRRRRRVKGGCSCSHGRRAARTAPPRLRSRPPTAIRFLRARTAARSGRGAPFALGRPSGSAVCALLPAARPHGSGAYTAGCTRRCGRACVRCTCLAPPPENASHRGAHIYRGCGSSRWRLARSPSENPSPQGSGI